MTPTLAPTETEMAKVTPRRGVGDRRREVAVVEEEWLNVALTPTMTLTPIEEVAAAVKPDEGGDDSCGAMRVEDEEGPSSGPIPTPSPTEWRRW